MHRPNDDGYITLAVLIFAGLMSVLVAGTSFISRAGSDRALLVGERLQAEFLIEGGLSAAGFMLFAEQREPKSVDGTTIALASGSVRIKVSDENGRVDLNKADPDLLKDLFAAAGCRSMAAEAFADRVVDWRDDDNHSTIQGAESFDYAVAGRSGMPPNRPFRSVDELRFLLGLNLYDFLRLRPFLTVYSPSPSVTEQNASQVVRAALQGPLFKAGGRTSALPQDGGGPNPTGASTPPVADGTATESSGVYRIRMEARTSDGLAAAAEAVIAKNAEGPKLFAVLAWSMVRPENPNPPRKGARA